VGAPARPSTCGHALGPCLDPAGAVTRYARASAVKAIPLPMLAKPAAMPCRPSSYAFEPKWDGFRAMLRTEHGLRVLSRRRRNMTALLPELDAYLVDGVFDGELIVQGRASRTSSRCATGCSSTATNASPSRSSRSTCSASGAAHSVRRAHKRSASAEAKAMSSTLPHQFPLRSASALALAMGAAHTGRRAHQNPRVAPKRCRRRPPPVPLRSAPGLKPKHRCSSHPETSSPKPAKCPWRTMSSTSPDQFLFPAVRP
jgi:hypothetical protein